MGDPNCWGCGKLIVNWDPADGPPMCTGCVQKEYEAYNPTPSRTQELLWRLLQPRHRRVHTGGPDPYAGDVYSFEVLGSKVELSTVVSFVVRVGRREWHEGYDGIWGSRWCRPRLKYKFRRIPDALVVWLGGRLFRSLEVVQDSRRVEDPYGSLAYYE